MIWRTAAEEKLSLYPAQLAAVQNLQEELKMLKMGKGRLPAPQYSTPRVCITPGRQEDRVLNDLARKQEMEWSLAQAKTWIRVTERALDTLSEGDRTLLQVLYMDPDEDRIGKLCRQLHVERSSIYRRRDSALRRFTTALYGGS